MTLFYFYSRHKSSYRLSRDTDEDYQMTLPGEKSTSKDRRSRRLVDENPKNTEANDEHDKISTSNENGNREQPYNPHLLVTLLRLPTKTVSKRKMVQS